MHYLVTGGAGFIGHHLVLRFLSEGHKVTVVDIVNDYYDPILKEARLKRFPEDVVVHRVDITDITALEEIFKSEKFDAVCHLAAQAGVRYSLEHPEIYIQTNYIGTFHIFELARKYDIRKVVFASTSSVYGTSTDMPFTEENPVREPMSIYASTKRSGELLGATYAHLYDMDITCLRFFTVYGPWGRPDMALFLFTDKILKGQPIDVYNNGEMRRDFTYVDDIVSGFVLATEKTKGFEIINLGNGKPVHLMEFIKTIEDILGKKAEINFMPLQPGDVPETYADITKAQSLLGYSPTTSIKEGVANFIDWYTQYYKS
ncbi:MAG: UDP-glucuronate 4-epimerase [Candidatus Azotimanducaceae bacterium]|jgi:UDP-glucuronate 4-epimerase